MRSDEGQDAKPVGRVVLKRVRLALFVVGAGGLGLWLLGYALRGQWMPIDILVGIGAPVVCVLTLLLIPGVGATRRWVFVSGCTLGAGCWALVLEGRTLVAPEVDEVRTDGTTLRLRVQNVGMLNPDPEGVLAHLAACTADVVVVVEPTWKVFAPLSRKGAVPEYPHRVWRERDDPSFSSPVVILSRWPLDRETGIEESLGIVARVERPENRGGPFVLAAVHPASPRDPGRWEHGNLTIGWLSDALGERFSDGEPVIVAGDLNGGPESVREGVLRSRVGLSRAQPLLRFGASYPSKSWPLGVSIDDVWHGPGTRVRAWSLVEIPGSDHLGVDVELRADP